MENSDMGKGLKKFKLYLCLLAVSVVILWAVLANGVSSSVANKFSHQDSPGLSTITGGGRDLDKNTTTWVTTMDVGHEAAAQVSDKVIVYGCFQMGDCGGWADRQKGIVGSYILSLMLRRRFKIHIREPCELTSYLLPNEVDWTMGPNELEGKDKVFVRAIDIVGLSVFTDLLKNEDLQTAMPHSYTVIQTNMEVVQFLAKHRAAAENVPWLKGLSVPDAYRLALTKLFKPGPKIVEQLEMFKKSVPAEKKLICAQVRIGDQSHIAGGYQLHPVEHYAVVETFLNKTVDPRNCRLLVTSDTPEIVERARRQFSEVFVTIPGPITHVDKTHGQVACEGFGKAVSEQLTLATCDVLVISESGFGKIAAFMRGRDSDLYLFYSDKLEPCARNSTFPSKEGW
ncbi:uncharacterized protein LOC112561730 isoform X3 [Pomacea canaliculata]|uniref:uncharacterized protein LOC112561730 isoform X3 n=1 Tax=Pomacea canaliculata TaxID=400727 RepID=UPI000D72F993|nr:uncharacterized protein LOC112561730 isoform X3 [Pomacea canaliculata]